MPDLNPWITKQGYVGEGCEKAEDRNEDLDWKGRRHELN
jgi:hypothetical protein